MDRGYACIGRSLRLSAERYPDKPALVEVDRLSLTYRELDEGANRLARMLLAKGLKKGDHVGMLSDNSVEHVVALYAAAKLGGVAVVLDPKWTPTEVARALSFFDCKILIVDDALTDHLAATDSAALPFGTYVYPSPAGRCELLAMTKDFPSREPGIPVLDHDVFTLMLTSGTTGFPKGCIRTHRNVEMGCINGAIGKGLDNTSRELAVVPIYYGSGRGSVMGQIYQGGTVYVAPKFDPERVADIIGRERISAIGLAPTMCGRLLKVPHLEKYDFSSLEVLRKAGSPFTYAMAEELIRRVTPNIYQGYASTESGGVTILKPDEQLSRVGSSGRHRWGVEIQIVDDDKAPLPLGVEGEIRVRGPNVCQGYYKSPEEQSKAFQDDWYHTGDIGRVDAEGYLYVVGRKKDFIKTGSINVSPREIENTILLMDGVDDVAVVGVPDPEWGEAVKAYIVVKEGRAVTPAEIAGHCKKTMAGYKTPKHIEFTDRIERNTLGKLTAEFKARAAAKSVA